MTAIISPMACELWNSARQLSQRKNLLILPFQCPHDRSGECTGPHCLFFPVPDSEKNLPTHTRPAKLPNVVDQAEQLICRIILADRDAITNLKLDARTFILADLPQHQNWNHHMLKGGEPYASPDDNS
ncbi:MAG TPA: hypothetical protein VJ327_09285 [Patescibacteria group bacterium]|nr:hypothetical protein [Patescibacteria group bacterium]